MNRGHMTATLSLARSWFAREWPVVLLLGVIAVTRFLWLDADPNVFKRPGDIGDEAGNWHVARDRVVFGTWAIPEDVNYNGLWAVPLFTLAAATSFGLFGVGFYAGRFPSALSGLLLLALLYFVLRRDYSRRVALLGLSLLGLNVHFFNYNRLGLVETLRLLLVFASLVAWLWPNGTRLKSAVFSALLMSAAMLTKVRPDFAFVPLSLWLIEWGRRSFDWKRVLAFTGTIGLIALIFGAYVLRNLPLLAGSIQYQLGYNRVTHWSVPTYLPFLPYAVLTNPVLTLLPVFLLFLLALPALTDDVGRFISSPRKFLFDLNPTETACLALFVGTLVSGIIYDYGDRRMFPLVLPLAILAARSVSSYWQVRIFSSKLSWSTAKVTLGFAAVGGLWASWWKDVSTNPWPDFSSNWWLTTASWLSIGGLALLALYYLYRTRWGQDARIILAALAATYLFILTELNLAKAAQDLLQTRWSLTSLALVAAWFAGLFLAVYLHRGDVLHSASGWTTLTVYLVFGTWIIGSQLIKPSFTMRNASREVNLLVRRGEVILSESPYEICTETEAKCVLWSADVSSDAGKLNREQGFTGPRKFWWAGRGSETPYYNPAESPCLYDSAGIPLGGLLEIGEFHLRRGSGNSTAVLYSVRAPAELGCQPRAEAD